MEKLLEKGLTCNRIFQHLYFYNTKRFTGKIRVFHYSSENAWSFYFASGNVIWAHGGTHPLRRWRRRFYAATGQLPTLKNIDQNAECWDCKALRKLLESKEISSDEVQTLFKGILVDILFDVVQAFEAPIYEQSELNNDKQLLSLSSLKGIGDGMQVEYQRDITPDRYYRLPSSLLPPLEELYDITYQTWKKWVEVGFARLSPNDAPLLLNPEAFRNSVSERIYSNMKRALQGYTSLRDLAFQFKHGDNFLKLAEAIAPYVERELICFQKIQDLPFAPIDPHATSTINQEIDPMMTLSSESSQDKPLLLMIDNNHKSHYKLNLVAKEYGYQFQVVDDSIKALHQFRANENLKPHLIFFNPEVSLLTEMEFCSIVHRLQGFEEIPIIVHYNREINRKQSQQALRAGAAEVLDAESFNYRKLKSILIKNQAQTVVQA